MSALKILDTVLEIRQEQSRLVILDLKIKICTNIDSKIKELTSLYWTGNPPRESSNSTVLIAAVPASSWVVSRPRKKCTSQLFSFFVYNPDAVKPPI
jgi:deferrochelatase/peroxidase EfeB